MLGYFLVLVDAWRLFAFLLVAAEMRCELPIALYDEKDCGKSLGSRVYHASCINVIISSCVCRHSEMAFSYGSVSLPHLI